MTHSLLSRLPPVRGRYLEDVHLSKSTWFQVGGPAEIVFKPADLEDLQHFLKDCPSPIPLHVIGVGSNLLVRDGGVPGVVIRLGRGFNNLFIDGTTMDVGAAVLDRNVALASAEASIEGFEFLCGIPGTLGGAIRMNAGAYGADMSEILEWVQVVDRKGKLHRLETKELDLSYRHCSLPKDWIFVGARLQGRKGIQQDIQARIDEYLQRREETQPVRMRTGGSTFANPEGHKAWELIDQAGCRGLTVGGAQMSKLHCNFMLNTGKATALDLETLAEKVRTRVKEASGIDLRWEIERIGTPESTITLREKKRVA